jgi:hypothetical protein
MTDDQLANALSEVLCGKTIKGTSSESIVLNDGTVLEFEGYGDCCAMGDVSGLEGIETTEHAITSVKVESGSGSCGVISIHLITTGGGDSSFRLVGNEGSGYYVYGVEIKLNSEKLLDVAMDRYHR